MWRARVSSLRSSHILTRPANTLLPVPLLIRHRHLRPQPQRNHNPQHLQRRRDDQRLLILRRPSGQKDVRADQTARICRERQGTCPERTRVLAGVVVVVPGVEHCCRYEGAHLDEEAGEVAGRDAVQWDGGEDDAADECGAESAGEEVGALAEVVGEPGVEVEPESCYYETWDGQAGKCQYC